MKPRYFIDQDDDCHWYLIPEIKREKWERWRDTDWKDSLADCALPDFVVDIGSPNSLTFTDPLEQ
jgi:hypothetical protein